MRKIKAEDKSMCDTVWMLHCRGLSVTDIQKRLGMQPGAVKDCIFYKWQTASIAAKKAQVMGNKQLNGLIEKDAIVERSILRGDKGKEKQ